MRAFTRLLLLLACIATSATGKPSFIVDTRSLDVSTTVATLATTGLPRGGGLIPGGWNPFGYKITKLGEQYLAFGGTLDGDVGRFLTSLKTRKTTAAIKSQWVEIVKVTKTGQTMRIYRTLNDLIKFCVDAGLIN